MMLNKLLHTDNAKTTLLIRLMVGAVFFSEGIQKFLFPETVGAGRFEKISFDNPEFSAHFTGSVEILCGSFILLGLLTRFAAFLLIILMLVAFVTTKYPILVDKGFWQMAHEYQSQPTNKFLFINLAAVTG